MFHQLDCNFCSLQETPPFLLPPPPFLVLLEYVMGTSTWVMGISRDSLGPPDNCRAPIFNRLGVVFSERSLKNSLRRDHQAQWSPVQDLLAARIGRLISPRGWTDTLSGRPLNPISYLSEGELSWVPKSSTAPPPKYCSPHLCTCHQQGTLTVPPAHRKFSCGLENRIWWEELSFLGQSMEGSPRTKLTTLKCSKISRSCACQPQFCRITENKTTQKQTSYKAQKSRFQRISSFFSPRLAIKSTLSALRQGLHKAERDGETQLRGSTQKLILEFLSCNHRMQIIGLLLVR